MTKTRLEASSRGRQLEGASKILTGCPARWLCPGLDKQWPRQGQRCWVPWWSRNPASTLLSRLCALNADCVYLEEGVCGPCTACSRC